MNASSWKKAVDLIAKVTPANPQVQAAATAESENLQSLLLSALAVDDTGPPQVTYDYQQPIAISTPRATSAETPEIPTEAYRQILPGMSDRLYPTLVADGSLTTNAPDNHGMLQTQRASSFNNAIKLVNENIQITHDRLITLENRTAMMAKAIIPILKNLNNKLIIQMTD